MKDRNTNVEWNASLCQIRQKEALIRKSNTLILVISEGQWQSLMDEDEKEALKQGKQIYSINLTESQDEDMSDECYLQTLLRDSEFKSVIKNEDACILYYGEAGLSHCCDLNVPAIVHAIPESYLSKAFTNQFGNKEACMIYVPPHWNIHIYVTVNSKTRISYWQLARLWETYGDAIYAMSLDELYIKYPQYFLNIYDDGPDCKEAYRDYPIQIEWNDEKNASEEIYETYYKKREQAIVDYINQSDSFQCIYGYFDEQLKKTEFDWKESETPGILVHGLKVKQAEKSRVMDIRQKGTLRKILREQERTGIQMISNFLFFFTPKLTKMYNDLRTDRPREQLTFQPGHIDYMLTQEGDGRVETFPLYKKACIAMKRDGNFLFFHHQLCGGSMEVDGCTIAWNESDVNCRNEESFSPVQIYTPYYSQKDVNEVEDYLLTVGEERLNLVIIQERIVCIRKGSVTLPCIGVVVSLSGEKGEEFLLHTNAKELEDGYYECENMHLQLTLDSPAEVSEEEWQQVLWAYGGGMTLFEKGRNLFPIEYQESMNVEETKLYKEGWMSPLSRQTQESRLHELTRHPRTAVGVTRQGEFFVLVYSGRTMISKGADYCEMCAIAQEMIPDIADMMNVDGGASSILGVSINGTFMELSYPATSKTNVAGMVREINTVLCLEG